MKTMVQHSLYTVMLSFCFVSQQHTSSVLHCGTFTSAHCGLVAHFLFAKNTVKPAAAWILMCISHTSFIHILYIILLEYNLKTFSCFSVEISIKFNTCMIFIKSMSNHVKQLGSQY